MFADWLTVRQDFSGLQLPQLHGGLRPVMDEGGTVLLRPSPLQVRGVNGSSFFFLFDGSRAILDGNIGRFGRWESVLGPSIAETKAWASAFMVWLGLPPFSGGSFLGVADAVGGRQSRVLQSGAVVTRCDLTANHAAGSPDLAQAWLSERQRFRRGQLKLSFIEGVLYFGYYSRHRVCKVYRKADDVEAKALPAALAADSTDAGLLSSLVAQLREQGVLRFEVEARRALKLAGLNLWDSLTDEACEAFFLREFDSMTSNVRQVGPADFAAIPREAVPALSMYLHGVDVRSFYSPPTFRKYRRLLLPHGYDLAVPASGVAAAQARDFIFRVPVLPAGYVGPQSFDPALLEAESRDQLEMFREAVANG